MPSNVSLQEEKRGADGRIVLAFRGTQLDNSQSSAADLCVDVLLWDAGAALPANCVVFDNSTLDYFSQAVHYTQQVTFTIMNHISMFTEFVNISTCMLPLRVIHNCY